MSENTDRRAGLIVGGVALALVIANIGLYWLQHARNQAALDRTITGVVQDGLGRPIDGAVVVATKGVTEDDALEPWAVAVSSSGGHFLLDPPIQDSWTLSASTPSGLTSLSEVGPGSHGVTLTVRRAAFTIRGNVRGRDGQPLRHAAIRAVRYQAVEPVPFYQAITNSSGSFRIGLGPETYELEASAPGYVRISRPVSIDGDVEFALDGAARVEGLVSFGGTGEPGGYAVVEAFQLDRFSSYWRRAATRADKTGHFVFNSLPPSAYRFDARLANEVGLSRRSVIAVPASTGTNARVELWPGRSVSGRVVDPHGVVVPWAKVTVWRESGGDGQWVTASAHGEFRITGVLPWSASLMVRAKGFMEKTIPVDLRGGDKDDLTIQLDRGAAISGRVVDRSGAAVEGAVIRAFDADDTERRLERGGATSGPDGRYEIDGLWSGNYVLEARQPEHGFAESDPAELTDGCGGRRRRDAGVDFLLAPGGEITGTIRNHDRSVASGATVFGTRIVGKQGDQTVVGTADAQGRYRLRALPAGDWLLSASRSGSQPIGTRFRIDQGFPRTSVSEASPSEVDLLLPQDDLSISGTLTDSEGAPISGATLSAVSDDHFGDQTAAAQTDDRGRFTLENLDEGLWSLDPTAPGFAGFTSWAPRRMRLDHSLQNESLHLARSAAVSGTVIDEAGKPVRDFFVDPGIGVPAITVHDSSGSFVLDGLSPLQPSDMVIRTPDGRIGSPGRLTLKGGEEVANVRVTVAAGVTATARLIDFDTGKPKDSVSVRVMEIGPGTRVRSDHEGTIVLEHLPLNKTISFAVEPPSEGSSDVYTFTTPAIPRSVDLGTLRPISDTDPWAMRDSGWIGLSAVWGSNGAARVLSVVPGSSADHAGIHAGDRLAEIDGRPVWGVGSGGLRKMLGGPPGSSVVVRIEPPEGGKPRLITLVRTALPRLSHTGK